MAAEYPGGYYYEEAPRSGGGVWRTAALVSALAILVVILGYLFNYKFIIFRHIIFPNGIYRG